MPYREKFGEDLIKFGDLVTSVRLVKFNSSLNFSSLTLSCYLWHCTSTWRRSNLQRTSVRVVKTLHLYPGRMSIWQAGVCVCVMHARRIHNSCMSLCMSSLHRPFLVCSWGDTSGHQKCSKSRTSTNSIICQILLRTLTVPSSIVSIKAVLAS